MNVPVLISGVVAFMVSIGEMVAGAVAYHHMQSPKLGAWWAGLVVCVSSLCAISSGVTGNRGSATAALVLAIIGVIITIVAVIVDGIGYGIVKLLVTCYNEETDTYTGPSYNSSVDQSNAFSCSRNSPCKCVRGHATTCYYYHPMQDSNNCNPIFNNYKEQLHTSYIFDWLAVVLVLSIAVLSCSVICGRSSTPRASETFLADEQDSHTVPVSSVAYPAQPPYPTQTKYPALNPMVQQQPVVIGYAATTAGVMAAPHDNAPSAPLSNVV